MSERTGLGPLEVAVLERVGDTGAHAESPAWVQTLAVLDSLERADSIGACYAVHVIQHLGVPWRVSSPLLELHGNWGSSNGDSMADPQYTKVRLSGLGRLALDAERGRGGPVPVGLVNGSVYRGGGVPPLDPRRTLLVLQQLVEGRSVETASLGSLVALPTGGVVSGQLDALLAGEPTHLRVTCPIQHEVDPGTSRERLVITGMPLGTDLDLLVSCLQQRVHAASAQGRRPRRALRDEQQGAPGPSAELAPISGVQDETTSRVGTRIVLPVTADADVDVAEAWTRSVWPVTVEVTWHIAGGLSAQLARWADRCRADRRGLDGWSSLVGLPSSS